MKLVKNKDYSGFLVTRTIYIDEIQAEAIMLEHQQSGAKILYLGCEDDNKVFTIGFKTPPEDDAGTPHILEHSVLCGSRKYPLKEPFVELVKGSLNTFLNAMTYPDKTVYPLASRNNKDFHNLMDVYLDAVFYPNIHKNEYTLAQEGWHYAITSKDEPLVYNGVVYNEMKGVFSTADAVMDYEAMKALFPDNAYRFESGGLPEAIPTLTQEKFLEFHKKFYHPENAYIYLYGDLDIENTLKYLDQEYLSAFQKTGHAVQAITPQTPFHKTKELSVKYPVGEDEDTKNKTYLQMQIIVGNSTDVKTSMAMRLLETVLLEMNSSPLKNALLEAKIGTDISGSYAGSYLQPIFTIKASGGEAENLDNFVKIIYATLQQLTIDGIDRELLKAAINSLEFKIREADFGAYPKGLIYGLSCFETWLYDGDPLLCLQFDNLLAELRSGLETRYFEQLIETHLLDNTHKLLVTGIPEPSLESKEHERFQIKMQEVKNSFNDEELEALITRTNKLRELQNQVDSPEALATIPLLERKDITSKIEHLPFQKEVTQESTFVFVPLDTKKIVYLNCRFDVSGITPELLPYTFLLTDLLGKVDTKNYTYRELATLASKYTGGLAFSASAISSADSAENFGFYTTLQGKVLEQYTDKLFDFLHEITVESCFDNKERLKEIINELKTDWDSQFFSRGQTIACTRLCSYFAASAAFNEEYYLSYYFFINKLASNFDEQYENLRTILTDLLRQLFHKNKSIISYASEPRNQKMVREHLDKLLKGYNDSKYAGKTPQLFYKSTKNEGIVTNGKVQYVALGGDYRKAGYQYTGAMKVLEVLLQYNYLWNKIRVQGGAYGATAKFNRNGIFYMASYRDPQLAQTLKTYHELPDFLKNLEITERELTKYIIGTISGLDTPLTNFMKLEKAALMVLKDLSEDVLQKERTEVLNISLQDLRSLAEPLQAIINEDYHCTVGSRSSLESNKEIFTNLITI